MKVVGRTIGFLLLIVVGFVAAYVSYHYLH